MPIQQHSSQSDSPQTIDELENYCFGCGTDNPAGLHLRFNLSEAEDGTPVATTTLRLTREHQGAPGFVHGGVIATILDEVMSKLNRPLGVLAMTRHIEIDYRRPTPLNEPLTLKGTHLRREGRKLFHAATLSDAEGRLLAECKGLFVIVDLAALER